MMTDKRKNTFYLEVNVMFVIEMDTMQGTVTIEIDIVEEIIDMVLKKLF